MSRHDLGELREDSPILIPPTEHRHASFTAEKLNLHARTNIDVIAKFLPAEFEAKQESQCVRIEVRASK
jgi:RNA 3'-terminal phosphate cyclase